MSGGSRHSCHQRRVCDLEAQFQGGQLVKATSSSLVILFLGMDW